MVVSRLVFPIVPLSVLLESLVCFLVGSVIVSGLVFHKVLCMFCCGLWFALWLALRLGPGWVFYVFLCVCVFCLGPLGCSLVSSVVVLRLVF